MLTKVNRYISKLDTEGCFVFRYSGLYISLDYTRLIYLGFQVWLLGKKLSRKSMRHTSVPTHLLSVTPFQNHGMLFPWSHITESEQMLVSSKSPAVIFLPVSLHLEMAFVHTLSSCSYQAALPHTESWCMVYNLKLNSIHSVFVVYLCHILDVYHLCTKLQFGD